MTRFVIGAAADSEGMAAVSASPRHENVAAPTARVTKTAGRWDHGMSPPNAIQPTIATTQSIRTETTIEFPTRPATNAHRGSGVARLRLRMPSSRSIVTDIARFWNVAE